MCNAFGSHVGVRSYVCLGGGMVRDDIDKLRSGQHIVVGTPGRIFDMVRPRHLRVDDLITVVLDVADELMARGFKDQIYDIFERLPPKVQVCLFSATIAPEIVDMTMKCQRDVVQIHVKRADDLSLEGIHQFYVAVEKEEWKLDTVVDLYDVLSFTRSIIYCNTRRTVDFLERQLTLRDFTISTTHAELEQKERDLVRRAFRSGSSSVLISTDVLDRDIDELEVSLVINYDLPSKPENYLHRIGRRGGVDRKRVALSLMTCDDVRIVKHLEKVYHTNIEEMPMDIVDLL